MKFRCQKDLFVEEISNASDFTAQRNTLTMMSCVYMSLSGNTLTIKTTDQKMGYVSEISVDGIEDGTTSVVCDKFLDIVKNLPTGSVLFEDIEEKLFIKSEQNSIEFRLRTNDPSGFPEITIPEEDSFFSIPQKDLTDMINQVSFAVSDDESKFAMNGALLEKDGNNGLIMVGTDGRRLSFIDRQIEGEIKDFEKITIPSKFLAIIRKHSSNEGIFRISITNQSIYVKTSTCIIFSSLIKNEFPAYRRVIPANQEKFCVVNISALEAALKRAALLVENKYKKVIIDFEFNKMIISTEETDLGAGKEEIECSYDGEPLRCAMNYTYILNPLKVMDGTQARIAFTESGRPFTVTCEPERDYKHIIMPMNLG